MSNGLLVKTGTSIREGKITGMSLDLCDEKQWIQGIRYERRTNPITKEEEGFLVDQMSGKELMKLLGEGVKKDRVFWFDPSLVYITEVDDIGKTTGNYLYFVNKSAGTVFRVSHLVLESGFVPQITDYEKRGCDLYYNESAETYANILKHLKENRAEDVKDLFVSIPERGFVRFLDNVDYLISDIVGN